MENNWGRRLRNLDYFGAPVGVTFDGRSEYKTKFGGCCTLLLIICFGSVLCTSLLGLFLNPTYSKEKVTRINY